jgi:hypothetical protein
LLLLTGLLAAATLLTTLLLTRLLPAAALLATLTALLTALAWILICHDAYVSSLGGNSRSHKTPGWTVVFPLGAVFAK